MFISKKNHMKTIENFDKPKKRFWDRTDLASDWLSKRTKALTRIITDLKNQKIEFSNKWVGDFDEKIDHCSEILNIVKWEIEFLLKSKINLNNR